MRYTRQRFPSTAFPLPPFIEIQLKSTHTTINSLFSPSLSPAHTHTKLINSTPDRLHISKQSSSSAAAMEISQRVVKAGYQLLHCANCAEQQFCVHFNQAVWAYESNTRHSTSYTLIMVFVLWKKTNVSLLKEVKWGSRSLKSALSGRLSYDDVSCVGILRWLKHTWVINVPVNTFKI